jgi:acetyl/propionyl-CoA carboxylase alpha subunit
MRVNYIYDSMISKLITVARTREEAIDTMTIERICNRRCKKTIPSSTTDEE